ncbi:glycosyltransferase family 4 protein [Opitutus sp. ER46]|uniref:glycosyltransferase family 4 protein n=1 Tax=Opitutus sp. ER46 TaxID=2161864 RepID=UPI000D31A440|nr:glycosyltransferase family 4 protein [Opitutus sp. ER46]PTX91088.1 glycosyltransferase WbuB [Opitutus sp. ER46]
MALVFVNRFYWPATPATGQLLTDLASHMAAQGWSVTVITSTPTGHPLPAFECHEGVSIVRTHGLCGTRRGLVAKAVAFSTFALAATVQLWRHTRRGDVVVALTDPPLIGVLAQWVARTRGARLVHWVHDIYPEIAVALSRSRLPDALRPWRNAAWRGADHCVTLGQDMADVLRSAGVSPSRLSVIPNWAPVGVSALPRNAPERLALRREWNLEDQFVVGYSGNLGRVHDLDPIVAAAALLKDDPTIAFVFVGDGPQHAALRDRVQSAKLDNVRFRPTQPRDRLSASLGIADLHLVTLRPGCERFVFPSKLYGIAAAGRPVLFVGPPDCEIARQVAASGIGAAVDGSRVADIAAEIRRFAASPPLVAQSGAAAIRFAEQTGANKALAQWHSLLAPLARS